MVGVWSEMGAYKRTSLLHFTSLTFLKLHSLTHILSGKFSILFCNGRHGGGASICTKAKVVGIDREYRGQ